MLNKEQITFVHKNGKVTTRQSAVYDGPGISCNYRQECIYVEIVMPTTCATNIRLHGSLWYGLCFSLPLKMERKIIKI